jgi:ATP-dependent Zn protease
MPDIEDETMFSNIMQQQKKKKAQPKIVYGGIFMKQLYDTIHFKTHEQSISEIKFLLAGFAAEKLLLGNSAYTCHQEDRQLAHELARNLIFGGFEATDLSTEQQSKFSQDAYDLIVRCENEVKELLSQNIKSLKEISEKLREYETLPGSLIHLLTEVTEGRLSIEDLQKLYLNSQPKQEQKPVVTIQHKPGEDQIENALFVGK